MQEITKSPLALTHFSVLYCYRGEYFCFNLGDGMLTLYTKMIYFCIIINY